jgi:hypothetical protein
LLITSTFTPVQIQSNLGTTASTVPKRWKCARVTPLFKG